MNPPTLTIIRNSIVAIIFAAIYWLFLEVTPFGQIFKPVDCWDSQDDFWLSKNQLALVFCAGLSFFILKFLKIKGWKGLLKTIAISYLCFQVFSITALYDVIYTQACFYPKSLAEIPVINLMRLLTAILLLSAIATGFCVAMRSIFKALRGAMRPKTNNSLKLD